VSTVLHPTSTRPEQRRHHAAVAASSGGGVSGKNDDYGKRAPAVRSGARDRSRDANKLGRKRRHDSRMIGAGARSNPCTRQGA